MCIEQVGKHTRVSMGSFEYTAGFCRHVPHWHDSIEIGFRVKTVRFRQLGNNPG